MPLFPHDANSGTSQQYRVIHNYLAFKVIQLKRGNVQWKKGIRAPPPPVKYKRYYHCLQLKLIFHWLASLIPLREEKIPSSTLCSISYFAVLCTMIDLVTPYISCTVRKWWCIRISFVVESSSSVWQGHPNLSSCMKLLCPGLKSDHYSTPFFSSAENVPLF